MKEKNDKNKFNLKNTVNDVFNDSQKKAWVVLGAYFIFFIVIIFSIRSNQTKNDNLNQNNSNLPFSISKIKSNNYDFKYTVNFDDNIIIYQGKNYQSNSLFTVNDLDTYYKEGEVFFKKENEVFVNSDNPYKFSELRNIDIVEKILNQAKLDSHTIYEDSTKIYNYQITTDTLEKIFNNRDIDTDLAVNKITVYVDKLNQASKFTFDFSFYANYKGYILSKGIVEVEYSNFSGNSPIKENVN